MTVSELIGLLSNFPSRAEVVVHSPEEGDLCCTSLSRRDLNWDPANPEVVVIA